MQYSQLPILGRLKECLDLLEPGMGLNSFTSSTSMPAAVCASCPLLKDDEAIKFECSDMPRPNTQSPMSPLITYVTLYSPRTLQHGYPNHTPFPTEPQSKDESDGRQWSVASLTTMVPNNLTTSTYRQQQKTLIYPEVSVFDKVRIADERE